MLESGDDIWLFGTPVDSQYQRPFSCALRGRAKASIDELRVTAMQY